MSDDGGHVLSLNLADGSMTIAETSRRRPDAEDVPPSALRNTLDCRIFSRNYPTRRKTIRTVPC
jgi:hypothetical protein